MSTRLEIIFWDFDGTLIPFDSEQFLLARLSLPFLKKLGAKLFVHGDRRGWNPKMLKLLYGWCLRGVPLADLDPICAQIATYISERDRTAIRSLQEGGLQMVILSCGTANLSENTLHAASLADAFAGIEANRLSTCDGTITGIERRIALPETKPDIVTQYNFSWEQTIAVGDGLTDLPLLDRAALPILIASGTRARRYADRGYHIVSSLTSAVDTITAAMQGHIPSTS